MTPRSERHQPGCPTLCSLTAKGGVSRESATALVSTPTTAQAFTTQSA